MSRINSIQQAIIQLDGGEYQKLMDAYLYKKYKYTNIEPLGSHTGTNKVTKGIPDSYVKLDNDKYVLIMYGTVESTSYEKIEKDIKSCLDVKKINIDIKEIEEIICCYTSTNIHFEQKKMLENMIEGVKITLIGIGSVSHDLLIKYPTIASDFLNIPIDTEQIFEIDEFIDKYDKNNMNASINMELLHRESEIESLINKIEENKVVLLCGKSGVGKTRLALEIARLYRDKHNAYVFCIKNNGQMLYNDLKYYLSDSGEYLLFIDDANQITQLEYVLDYVITPPEGINVKIIMTVRDYAKDRVKQVIYNKIIPKEEEIGLLNDDIIKEILNKNLGIKNNQYLDQIARISKGNARLAVLAGRVALKNGLASIYNTVDIFKYYYGQIIEKEFFDRNKIIAAFVITLLGPFEYKSNEVAIKILENNGISEDEFYELCHELNNSEIIDLYMDKAVKISDQSMGDYLLYYVLIEKRYVILADIIKDLFKEYRRKLIYSLNTIIRLFNNKECLNYIEYQVNNVWNTIEDDNEKFEYVKTFHTINEEKSLAYIKSKIDKMEKEDIQIDNFDLKERKNNNSIKSDIAEVLGGFKYSKNYELMLELIIYYFNKKPSEIFDFYILFSDRLGYDQNSFDFQYKKELLNLEYLWKYSNKGVNANLTILLLNIIENYIGFEFHRTESHSIRTVNFITVNLCMCEGLEKLRKTIWSILGELYNQEKYKNSINKILLKYNPYSKNEKQLKLIYEMDFKYIKKYIFNQIISPDFIQCKVLKHFKRIVQRLNVAEDTILEKYKENVDFLVYNTLVKTHELGQDWRAEEEKRKENIYNMVKEYEEDDFIKLFNLCNSILDKSDNRETWEIQSGIILLFDGIKENSKKYITAIKAYLKCDTPLSNYISNKISTLIKFIGIEETEKIILSYEYKQKNSWIYEFLFCIPIEKQTTIYANLLRNTFEDEIKKEQPVIPNIQFIALYKDIDENIVCDLASKLLTINSFQRSYAIQSFLGHSLDKDYSDMILSIFMKDINILENLYLEAFECDIDYEGNLFVSLVENNIKFLEKFTQQMININNKDYYIEKFEKLWEQENYDELIKISFDTIISSKDNISLWICETNIQIIFMTSANISKIIEDRKVEWVKNYIKTISDNADYLNLIFQVVMSTLRDHTVEFILYFLNINKNIEIFKEIKLFPTKGSWSGSEVPLIEKEIIFLNELIDSMSGIHYIEHKAYLKELILNKEKYKQQVLVREYLENRDLS